MCAGPGFARYFRILCKVAVAICENKMKADKKLIIYPNSHSIFFLVELEGMYFY